MTHRIFDKHRNAPAHIQWHEVWPDTPGLGKAVKRIMHKAQRRAAQEEIAYELGEIDRIRARGLRNSVSEVNWRTH